MIKKGKNGNNVIIFTKMSVFWGVVGRPFAARFYKVSLDFFIRKDAFVSMSVRNTFFHVILKVSGAIAKMDIFKMSVFWGVKPRQTSYFIAYLLHDI